MIFEIFIKLWFSNFSKNCDFQDFQKIVVFEIFKKLWFVKIVPVDCKLLIFSSARSLTMLRNPAILRAVSGLAGLVKAQALSYSFWLVNPIKNHIFYNLIFTIYMLWKFPLFQNSYFFTICIFFKFPNFFAFFSTFTKFQFFPFFQNSDFLIFFKIPIFPQNFFPVFQNSHFFDFFKIPIFLRNSYFSIFSKSPFFSKISIFSKIPIFQNSHFFKIS